MPRRRKLTDWALLLALAGAVSLSGCTVGRAVVGEPGADLKPVAEAATRQRIEELLGSSIREWDTGAGVRYAVYRYDAGQLPSLTGATAHAFMDVATLGVWEVVMLLAAGDPAARHTIKQAAIGYDAQDRVLCVVPDMGDLDALDPERCKAPRAPPAQATDRAR